MADPVDVEVNYEWSYANDAHYSVWVDGVKIDEFTSHRDWLTMAERRDVANGYREGLTGYQRCW